GAERVADAGGASGWANRGEYEREPGDGEGREWGYFDGDGGGNAGAVRRLRRRGRRGAGGGGGGLSAWAGRGFCGAGNGRAYGAGDGYSDAFVGCVSLQGEGCGWDDVDLRIWREDEI